MPKEKSNIRVVGFKSGIVLVGEVEITSIQVVITKIGQIHCQVSPGKTMILVTPFAPYAELSIIKVFNEDVMYVTEPTDDTLKSYFEMLKSGTKSKLALPNKPRIVH